jgi:hypothetical protein
MSGETFSEISDRLERLERGLWRISGVVTAADSTSYRPLVYLAGGLAREVFDAICEGARDRGDGFDVHLAAPASWDPVTGEVVGWRAVSDWSGPVRDVGRPAFEVVGLLEGEGRRAETAPGSVVFDDWEVAL